MSDSKRKPGTGEGVDRRCFLKAGAGCVAGAALLTPTGLLLQGCGSATTTNNPDTWPKIPNQPNGTYVFDFGTYPQLQSAGGTIQVRVMATSGAVNVSVTRLSSTTAKVVSTTCTHASCTLNPYDPGSSSYACPCHGSAFNGDGSVKNGPATTPLSGFITTVTSTGISAAIP